MKMPMPPEMACWSMGGMDWMMSLRSLVAVMMMLIRPQMKTMDMACCQVKPRPLTTVKVKKALRPTPGARA